MRAPPATVAPTPGGKRTRPGVGVGHSAMTTTNKRFARRGTLVALVSLTIPVGLAVNQPGGLTTATAPSLSSRLEAGVASLPPAPLAGGNLLDLAMPAVQPVRTYWDGGEAARRRWERRRLAALTPPVAQLAKQPAPAAPGVGTADWFAIAMCESSGRWDLNTGNGFWGGLQFTPSTWFGYGGGPFDGSGPFPYSAGQQIAVAERVLATQGPSAWPNCFTWG